MVAGKLALGLGALAVATAAPLVWLGYGRGGTAPAVDLTTPSTALAGQIRTAHAQAAGRAQALADLRVLADAVATDAATVLDMTSAERGFRPRGDERIEIGQVPVGGGVATSLLRLPDGAPPLAGLERTGARVIVDGAGVRAAEVVPVTPSDAQRATEVRGLLAVSQPIDLWPVISALGGRGAVLAIGDAVVPLGPGLAAGAGGADVVATVIDGAPEVELRQARPAAVAAAPTWARVGGPLAAALGLALLGLGVGGRRRGAAGAGAAGAGAGAGSSAAGVGGPAPGRPAAELAAVRPPSAVATTVLDGGTARAVAAGSGLDGDGGDGDAPRTSATMEGVGGSRFGRYQTLSLLGSGGMADVYLARATGEAGFARRIALKVLQPHMARRPEAVGYFLNEARLAAQLTHPCIVQVFDLGRAGDDYYIAMEYVDGADLDHLLRAVRARGAQVPASIALAILRRVCDGLHAAHVARGDDGAPLGIIHRDVKTANVLLSSEGAVKVGDFGIARAATGARTTSVGQTRGTVEVMAPEQRTGGEIDVRADVYGVAAIGYELLSGAPVNLDLAILLQYGVPGWPHLPPLSRARPELPAELDAIILGALAFDPADRPASCAALEELLAAVVTAHGLLATDKDLAAWLAAERALQPAAAPAPATLSLS